MRIIAALTFFLAFCSFLSAGVIDPGVIHRRGDANDDSTVDIADVTYIYNFLFYGGPQPPCMNQADVNHDGQVNVADPSYLTNWLYLGGPAPPSPGPYATSCSESDAPVISCVAGC